MTSIINSSIQRAVTQLRRACAVGDATLALETIVKAVPDYDAQRRCSQGGAARVTACERPVDEGIRGGGISYRLWALVRR